jgi:hypothetical protein
MSDPDIDAIVANYFRRLDNVLVDVPEDRREQLTDELREHVRQARAVLEVESAAAIHEVLERIGTPEEIAAAESTDNSDSSGIVAYFLRRGSSSGRRSPMTEKRWCVLGAIAGFVFAIAYLVSTLIAPSAPNVNSDVNTVTSYFSSNVHSLLASGLIGTSAAFVFLVFVGSIHRVLLRADEEGAIPASIVFASGTVFAAVTALSTIFTTTLAILAGQANGSFSSASYVPATFLLRTMIGTGVFGIAAALLLGALGIGMVNAKLVGRWLGFLCIVLAACNAAGGGAALILGSYNRAWMIIQSIGMFGIAFVVLSASVVVFVHALPALGPRAAEDEVREHGELAGRLGLARPRPSNPRLVGIAVFGALIVAASIAVPLSTRGTNSQLSTAASSSVGAPSGTSDNATGQSSSSSASVGYDGPAICAPTTDAATSGGSPATLMHAAKEVASGTIEGKSWSLWSANGQSGASGLEDGGVVFNGDEYGLCAGYPNPSETEMIDTGGDAIIYGVVDYPGLAQVQVSTGSINSFAVGTVLPSPHVSVVNGVSFYIGTLPQSACSYSYFEINTTSTSYSAQHNIGFGDSGVGQGYSITNNPGNVGGCVTGRLDPLSYSQGVWQLPPGQFNANG